VSQGEAEGTATAVAAPEFIAPKELTNAPSQGLTAKTFAAAIATLIATVGQHLGQGHLYGNVMVWAAPTIALIIPPVALQVSEMWADRREDTRYEKAHGKFVALLENPQTSKEHKKEMQILLQAAERARAERLIERSKRNPKSS